MKREADMTVGLTCIELDWSGIDEVSRSGSLGLNTYTIQQMKTFRAASRCSDEHEAMCATLVLCIVLKPPRDFCCEQTI